MKHSIGIAGAACLFALGTVGASAAATRQAHETPVRPAVWMRIKFPDGGARMAIAYDKTLVTAMQGATGASAKTQGWGFRPIIQKDGTVKVKVYRLRFTGKDPKSKADRRLQYVETLTPRPVATTTQPSDRHIRIKIMGTGPVAKLKTELREFLHIARWQP